MKKILSILSLCLCLIVLVVTHSGSVYAVDTIGSETSWQKDIESKLSPDLPLADILIPLNFLNGPILTEEVSTFYPQVQTETKAEAFSFLNSDLPPPAL